MEIRRIAILTLGARAAHMRAAQAIHQALHDGADNVEARTIDALDRARPWFVRLCALSHGSMARSTPAVWRRLWEWQQRKRLRRTSLDWIFRHACRPVLSRLQSFRPHLVIVVDSDSAQLAALGRREGWFDASILAAQADFYTEPRWVKDEIDVYCAGSEAAKNQLISLGASHNRILTCGVPVDPAFAASFDRADLRRALGLHLDRPVVLVMVGRADTSQLEAIIRSLEMCRQPIHVLAVAGRDRAVRARLDALRCQLALDLHVFGWSDYIPELMGAADLLITTPCSVTTSEALAAGLPMVLTRPSLGVEEQNFRFLVERRLALAVAGPEQIPPLVSSLLDDPKQVEELREREREAARPDAAYSVAQVARALLEKETYIDLLASPPQGFGERAYLM